MAPTAQADATRFPPPDIVGRAREQALLREQFAAAAAGRGGVVLVGGEAGIGKTTLVSEAVEHALAAGASVLTGQCYDLTTTPSYGPWLELFDRLRASEAAPQLTVALTAAGIHPEKSTSRTAWFDDVRTFIRDAATERTLVIVLEDMHWADDASLELLRYLARGLGAQRVLLLATYRDDELTRRHPLFQLVPLLVREAAATRLHIPRFEGDALEALVTSRYALESSDRARLVAYLLRLSDGNPFFTNELLRALEDERRCCALAPVGGSPTSSICRRRNSCSNDRDSSRAS